MNESKEERAEVLKMKTKNEKIILRRKAQRNYIITAKERIERAVSTLGSERNYRVL